MRDMDLWGFNLIAAALVVAIFLGAWIEADVINTQCIEYGELTGYETTLISGGECIVNH
ncbi:MAG: hypothetical protein GY764_11390, partial [Halieaceae bacterium]|nr:hypothetical protein [Halieaceae bacterium]